MGQCRRQQEGRCRCLHSPERARHRVGAAAVIVAQSDNSVSRPAPEEYADQEDQRHNLETRWCRRRLGTHPGPRSQTLAREIRTRCAPAARNAQGASRAKEARYYNALLRFRARVTDCRSGSSLWRTVRQNFRTEGAQRKRG